MSDKIKDTVTFMGILSSLATAATLSKSLDVKKDRKSNPFHYSDEEQSDEESEPNKSEGEYDIKTVTTNNKSSMNSPATPPRPIFYSKADSSTSSMSSSDLSDDSITLRRPNEFKKQIDSDYYTNFSSIHSPPPTSAPPNQGRFSKPLNISSNSSVTSEGFRSNIFSPTHNSLINSAEPAYFINSPTSSISSNSRKSDDIELLKKNPNLQIKNPTFWKKILRDESTLLLQDLLLAHKLLYKICSENNLYPIFLRLAFADASNFDKSLVEEDILNFYFQSSYSGYQFSTNVPETNRNESPTDTLPPKTPKEWPYCGGCNGSIRFKTEYQRGSGGVGKVLNPEDQSGGLTLALEMLASVKDSCQKISWADLIQLAGAVAVQSSNGPSISLRYGREDMQFDILEAESEEQELLEYQSLTGRKIPCISIEGLKKRSVPHAFPPYPDGEIHPAVHVQLIFDRLDFDDRSIVALCGAHTIGRAFKDRTGVCPFASGDNAASKYTRLTSVTRSDGYKSRGLPGGGSWTPNWLQFDNTYYKMGLLRESISKNINKDDQDEMKYFTWMPSDQALLDNPEFRRYFVLYASDNMSFFHDYTIAHIKMSELGANFASYSFRFPLPDLSTYK